MYFKFYCLYRSKSTTINPIYINLFSIHYRYNQRPSLITTYVTRIFPSNSDCSLKLNSDSTKTFLLFSRKGRNVHLVKRRVPAPVSIHLRAQKPRHLWVVNLSSLELCCGICLLCWQILYESL